MRDALLSVRYRLLVTPDIGVVPPFPRRGQDVTVTPGVAARYSAKDLVPNFRLSAHAIGRAVLSFESSNIHTDRLSSDLVLVLVQ